MVSASLVATVSAWSGNISELSSLEGDAEEEPYDPVDGPSEEEAYLQGEYKTILHR